MIDFYFVSSAILDIGYSEEDEEEEEEEEKVKRVPKRKEEGERVDYGECVGEDGFFDTVFFEFGPDARLDEEGYLIEDSLDGSGGTYYEEEEEEDVDSSKASSLPEGQQEMREEEEEEEEEAPPPSSTAFSRAGSARREALSLAT